MSFKAIHSTYSIVYSICDAGTSRCRVSPETLKGFTKFPINIGSIIRLLVTPESNEKFEVLCTIWPDLKKSSEPNSLCFDCSTYLNNVPMWVEGTCEIISCSMPKPCNSIKYTILQKDEQDIPLTIGSLLSMPLANSFTISVTNTFKITIKKISVEGFGMIHPGTALIEETIQDSASQSLQSTNKDIVSSRTKIVDEIIRKVIDPVSSRLPTLASFQGILLLGPPGVGKSYSLQVIKQLCQDYCDVHIIDINIPELLSEINPLEALKEKLKLSNQDNLNSSKSKKNSNQSPMKTKITKLDDFSSPVSKTDLLRSPLSPISSLSLNPTPSKSQTKDTINKEIFVKPSITLYLLDEIDSLGNHKNQSVIQMAIKSYLFRWFDQRHEINSILFNESQNNPQILSIQDSFEPCCLIATTNRAEDIDIGFRRGGRLELELYVLNQPSDRKLLFTTYLHKTIEQYRLQSIKQLEDEDYDMKNHVIDLGEIYGERFQGMKLKYPTNNDENKGNNQDNSSSSSSSSLQFGEMIASLQTEEMDLLTSLLAERSGGYVAADISTLIRELNNIPMIPLDPVVSSSSPLNYLTSFSPNLQTLLNHFDRGMKQVPPSCLRGITVTLPQLTYDDVIGNQEAKKMLQRALYMTSPEMKHKLAQFGITQSLGGVLLYGPPGNSKTRLISAAAAVNKLPLISLTSADIFSAFVGDAEAEVRKAFTIARQAAPCILFFDEMDSMVTNRATNSSSSSSSVESRILSTFLNEMDGVSTNAGMNGVIVIGATNRIDCIDAALLRKGRFYQTIHVLPPNAQEQIELIEYFAKKYEVNPDHLPKLKESLREGLSGADIENICKQHTLLKQGNLGELLA